MRYVCEYSGVTRVIDADSVNNAKKEMLFIVTGIREFLTGNPVKVSPVMSDEIIKEAGILNSIAEGGVLPRFEIQAMLVLSLLRKALK